MPTRSRIISVEVLIMICLGISRPATAGLGDFGQTLFRGFEYAGAHSYVSDPQGGPLYDFNQFSQRVEYNRLGQGYTWESYRFFGADSYGNQNTVDLGPLKVQLGFDPNMPSAGQPIGVHERIGYTTTLLPELFFNSESGQRAINQFTGISNFAPAPLHYTVTVNTGVEDFQWSGDAIWNMSGRVNALGFYDFSMRFTNVGNYEADGYLLKDEQPTDFDLGPIDVSGNVLFDSISAILQSVGAQALAVPTRVASGAADRDKKTDDLLARLHAGEKLSDAEMQYLVQRMIETAFEADPLGVLQNGLPAQVPGFEDLTLAMTATSTTDSTTGQLVPEAGTLGLVAVGLIAMAGLRRRRGR